MRRFIKLLLWSIVLGILTPWAAFLVMYLGWGLGGSNNWVGNIGVFLWAGEFRVVRDAICNLSPAFSDIDWNHFGYVTIFISSTVGWFFTWLILLGGAMVIRHIVLRYSKSRDRKQDA